MLPNRVETLRTRSSATTPRTRNVGVGAKDSRPLGLVHASSIPARPAGISYIQTALTSSTEGLGQQAQTSWPQRPTALHEAPSAGQCSSPFGGAEPSACRRGTHNGANMGDSGSEGNIPHGRAGRSGIESRGPGPDGLVVSTEVGWTGQRLRGAGMRTSAGRHYFVIGSLGGGDHPCTCTLMQRSSPAAFPDLPPRCKWPVGVTACPGFHPFKEMLRRSCSHRLPWEMRDYQHVPPSR